MVISEESTILDGSVTPTSPVALQTSGLQISNRLLTSLPPQEFQRLHQYLKVMRVSPRQRLYKQDELVDHVYFPNQSCVCAITKSLSDGSAVQVSSVGNEGVVGTHVVFGGRHVPSDVAVHLAGDGVAAMPVAPFLRALETERHFADAVMQFYYVSVRALMQHAACNAMHSAEERCCRWILETADRANAAEFPMTHEYLAAMMGVRRPTVTLVCAALQHAGAVSYRRGFVKIEDRSKLEAACCECYTSLRVAAVA